MNAVAVQIADAVVNELNDPARDWSGNFIAQRSWKPVWDEEELKTLRVDVVSITLNIERETRGELLYTYGIAVEFQKLICDASDTAEVDGLVKMIEGVVSFFSDEHPLADLTDYRLISAQNPIVSDPISLDENHKFDTVVELEIEGRR